MGEGFYFYIVQCSDDSYYIGHTDNLEQRISNHNASVYLGYTSSRLPVKLVYFELFPTRDEAFVAEHKVKRWSRKKKEILIRDGWHGFNKQETVRMDSQPTPRLRRTGNSTEFILSEIEGLTTSGQHSSSITKKLDYL